MPTLVPELRREPVPESVLAHLLAPRGAVGRSADRSVGAPHDRLSLAGIDLDQEAVIQGRVTRGGSPTARVRVRLLDEAGAFVAEVPTAADGTFRFFAAPGAWTVTLQAEGAPAPARVCAVLGGVVELRLVL